LGFDFDSRYRFRAARFFEDTREKDHEHKTYHSREAAQRQQAEESDREAKIMEGT
jgi:hypothetical protein